MLKKETYKRIILILLLGLNLQASAQLLDSMKHSFEYKPKLFFKLDSRTAFVSDLPVKMAGFKFGLNFNKTTYVGLGYMRLKTDFPRFVHLDDSVHLGQLRMGLVTPFIEYFFYKKKRWHVSIPVQLGLGYSRYTYTMEGKKHFVNGHFVMNYEPTMVAEYYLLKWFSLGAGIGYRIMLVNNPHIEERMNSPIYIFRASVHLKVLHDMLFKRGE